MVMKMKVKIHFKFLSDNQKHRISDKYGDITNIHFKDENLKKILAEKSHPDFSSLDMFLKCLAICHGVIVERDEFKNIEYHASSMDEKALVNGARYLNYIYKEKDVKNNMIIEINGQDQKFELLNIIEFDSKRKRMSVIVKDLSTQKIILFIKGSDSILRGMTTLNKEYLEINQQHLIDFCSLGLRNFNIGYRYIDNQQYVQWNEMYKVNFFP
jgi:phospholipid-transporting ATPase